MKQKSLYRVIKKDPAKNNNARRSLKIDILVFFSFKEIKSLGNQMEIYLLLFIFITLGSPSYKNL